MGRMIDPYTGEVILSPVKELHCALCLEKKGIKVKAIIELAGEALCEECLVPTTITRERHVVRKPRIIHKQCVLGTARRLQWLRSVRQEANTAAPLVVPARQVESLPLVKEMTLEEFFALPDWPERIAKASNIEAAKYQKLCCNRQESHATNL